MVLAAMTVVAVVALGACGSDADTSTPATTTAAAVDDGADEGSDAPDDAEATSDADAADRPDGDEVPASPADTAAPDPDLCAVAAPLLVVVPREHVGSDGHVAELEALLAVAPEEIVDDVAVMVDHYRDAVSPAVPASQDFVNFPPVVQDTAVRVQGFLTDRC
ncbi:MAG: hypothetical protein ACXIVQ_13370 [Acidimicrobiales bacterium]